MTRYEHLRHEPRPTKKQEDLYRGWREYLKNSSLSEMQQHERASWFADRNKEVPLGE